MSSPQQLFSQFVTAFGEGSSPAPNDYLGQVDGADRLTLSVLIDDYLIKDAPARPFDPARLEAEMQEPWGQAIHMAVGEAMAECTPEDLRLAREHRDLKIEELADVVLAAGSVNEPTAEEKRWTVGALGQLERGEMAGTDLMRRAWDTLAAALGIGLPPTTGRGADAMSFRRAAPASPGVMNYALGFTAPEAIMMSHAAPSPRSRNRAQEFFLGSVDHG